MQLEQNPRNCQGGNQPARGQGGGVMERVDLLTGTSVRMQRDTAVWGRRRCQLGWMQCLLLTQESSSGEKNR